MAEHSLPPLIILNVCTFLFCSKSTLSCSLESPWWLFLWHQHQIEMVHYIKGAFTVWADSHLCLLIVCISSFTLKKKLPLTSLSQAMVEGGNQLGEDSLIGWVCDEYGQRISAIQFLPWDPWWSCMLMHPKQNKNTLTVIYPRSVFSCLLLWWLPFMRFSMTARCVRTLPADYR